MRISASRLFPSSTLRLALVACLCLLVFCAQASAAGPFRRNFSYYADRQELGTVLMNFAQAEGYTAAVSPAVKGKVSKFLLALGYLICGAGLLFFDFLYRAGGALYEEAWTTAIITENFERLNWALIVGAAICFLACVVMFITGCMIKRKSREI